MLCNCARGKRAALRARMGLAAPASGLTTTPDVKLIRGTYAVGIRALAGLLGLSLTCVARGADTVAPTADPGAARPAKDTVADMRADTVEVVAERFDKARNALSPKTGTSQFVFDAEEIALLPRGENTPIIQMLLQAPGVVQGDYGELHIRGEMTQPQYRINGTIIPDGISGFGQVFDPRFAQRIEFITGALPAQYNYRTNVIEIQTKERFDDGGKVSLYGGSYGTISPTVELGGSKDKFTYYVIGNYFQSENGILLPTAGRDAIHDDTTQSKGFAYASFIPDPKSRWSLIVGAAQSNFEIPNVPGQTSTFPLDGVSAFPDLPSADLNERQHEVNRYAVISYEGTNGANLDYQVAFFTRYSSVLYTPDIVGDLIYRGIASRVQRANTASGVQVDTSLELSASHTMRTGFSASHQRTDSDNNSQVFPADASGNQIPGAPFTVDDSRSITANLTGIYVQDEWRPTQRLTINYGLRFDYLDGLTQSSQLSPRVGAVYKWTDRTTLHAGYARYFDPPRLELIGPDTISKFANTTNQPEVLESSPVLPERINYFDIGVTHRMTPELNLGLDSYAKYAQDLNDFGQFGQALVYSPFNWTQARIYGIELTAQYRKSNLSAYVNAGISWARAKGISSGQFNFGQDELDYINSHWVYMDHDQRLTASGGVAYRWSEFQFLADALFGSGMRSTPDGGTPNSDHLPAYVQVNLGVVRYFQTKSLGKLETRLSVVNVFDRSYEIRDGTGVGVGAPQFGPRRSVFVTLSATF